VRTDITSHKKREEFLRESDEFLENVVEGLQAGVCVLDGAMRCVFTNHRFEEMTGIRRTQVVAGRIKLVLHPEDLDRTTISVLEAVAGRAARCRSRLCTADGAVTEVEFLMTPLNWKGLRLALALVLEPSSGPEHPVQLT
jgi:PAS domain S-box-containing protein